MPLIADIPGSIERGLQFRQAEQLRPVQQQTAQLGLEQKQQDLQLGGIKGLQAQENLTRDKDANTFVLNVRSAMELDLVPNEQKAEFLINKIQNADPNRDMTQSKKALELVQSNRFQELDQGTKQLLSVAERSGIIKAPIVAKPAADFTLSAGQTRFGAEGEEIASVAPKAVEVTAPVQEIPPILLEGLSEDLALKGAAAYKAAGGGKDGLASFQKVIDKGTEQERRLTSPKLIQSSFPQASAAETVQLQAAMDAARTTETGLKAAGKIREEQRRLVKVQGFQDRSIVLLDKLLASDELGDVLGSIEGTIDFRLQDSEAELIADIEEVGDILTADNLKLMSGVLSESDIKILRNLAGGGLKRTRTEKRFRADVQAIRDEMAAKRVLTVDDKQASTQQQAPAAAIEMLKQNPQFAGQFNAKFGFLPEGF